MTTNATSIGRGSSGEFTQRAEAAHEALQVAKCDRGVNRTWAAQGPAGSLRRSDNNVPLEGHDEKRNLPVFALHQRWKQNPLLLKTKQ